MTTAQILSIISMAAFGLSGVCLVLAVIFWFVFKIPSVIGDLSGRTARKSIEKMRQTSDKTERRTRAAQPAVSRASEVAVSMAESNPPIREERRGPDAPDDWQTQPLADGQQTQLLVQTEETELLNEATGEAMAHPAGSKLTMLEEVMLIHTDEIIDPSFD